MPCSCHIYCPTYTLIYYLPRNKCPYCIKFYPFYKCYAFTDVSVTVIFLALYINWSNCRQINKCVYCILCYHFFISVMHWEMSVYLPYFLSYIYTDLIVHQGINVLTANYLTLLLMLCIERCQWNCPISCPIYTLLLLSTNYQCHYCILFYPLL